LSNFCTNAIHEKTFLKSTKLPAQDTNLLSAQIWKGKIKEEACPKVSIIIPTYNRADFIIETIKSVSDQTYQNWEIIVIDDGSDDDTEERIFQLNDERIQFYKAGRIGINGKIKNIGIKKSTGDFIAFIDSDDLWHPEKLEKQINALQKYPEAGFSMTGGYNFKNLDEPIDFFYKQTTGFKYGNILIPFFQSQISTTTPSLVMRRGCLRIAGLFDETKPFSDIDYILKLTSHFNAVILYEPLLYRRLHESNDSNQNWIKGFNQGTELIETYKNKLPKKVVDDALFRLHIDFGEYCLRHKKNREAFVNFFKAWSNRPYSIIPFKKTGKLVLRILK
jgi:glycosyltransferase involved in cell wall biosynthesis